MVNSIWILLIVVISFCGSVSAAFYGQQVRMEDVTKIEVVNKPCECKELCNLDPECGMSSSKNTKNGLFECRLSEQKNSSLLEENPDGVSWISQVKPDCETPFELIDGVGCIHLPERQSGYMEAHTLCPHGSQLYSPPTLAIFENLRLHLWHLATTQMTSAKTFWLGATRNKTGAYVWRTGGYIAGTDPERPTIVTPGTYPFGTHDPNDPDIYCIGLLKGFQFLFYDVGCERQSNVICQLY